MHPPLQLLNLQTLVLLSLALTPAAPYVTAFLTQSRLPAWVNEVIAFLVCLVAGFGSFLASGGTFTSLHSSAGALAAVGAIFTGAKLFYTKLGWKSPLLMALKHVGVTSTAPASPAVDPPPVNESLPSTNTTEDALKLLAALTAHTASTQANTTEAIHKTIEMSRADLLAPPVAPPAPAPPIQSVFVQAAPPASAQAVGGSPDGSAPEPVPHAADVPEAVTAPQAVTVVAPGILGKINDVTSRLFGGKAADAGGLPDAPPTPDAAVVIPAVIVQPPDEAEASASEQLLPALAPTNI